jgi:glyoxylate reductase
VLTDSTADVAMLCMLGAVRRVREVQHMLYSGCWRGWAPTDPLGYELNGAPLGIVGMGRIGQAVAKRASSFGMRVQYWNRRPVAVHGGTKARHVPELDDLFRDSDVISLHVAPGPQTRHLVNARRLALSAVKRD